MKTKHGANIFTDDNRWKFVQIYELAFAPSSTLLAPNIFNLFWHHLYVKLSNRDNYERYIKHPVELFSSFSWGKTFIWRNSFFSSSQCQCSGWLESALLHFVTNLVRFLKLDWGQSGIICQLLAQILQLSISNHS